jgi:hypothetical protein
MVYLQIYLNKFNRETKNTIIENYLEGKERAGA